MKTRSTSYLILIAGLALPGLQTSFAAQPFASGSDGSYGAMNITANTTLDLPPDGIFRCTTINVASGATLRFSRNALNTPVWLLATGDVTISGVINVSGGDYSGRLPGLGGPGGFDGGEGGYGGTGFGGTGGGADGHGPGGGRHGSYFPFNSYYGQFAGSYGNALIVPLIGGSGGAGSDGSPGSGGGGGGGAILVASNTKILVNGTVPANGGNGHYAGGSGGAIRLVAPIVTGVGSLDVRGGQNAWSYLAGNGYLRIDSQDPYLPRSLRAYGSSSRGAQMFVFPAVQPRLDIIEAAGQAIPFPATNGVVIALPLGADPTQIVKVRASGFTNDVAITVAVVPTDRASSTNLAVISMTNNPVVISVPVTLAADSTNRIYVWTR